MKNLNNDDSVDKEKADIFNKMYANTPSSHTSPKTPYKPLNNNTNNQQAQKTEADIFNNLYKGVKPKTNSRAGNITPKFKNKKIVVIFGCIVVCLLIVFLFFFIRSFYTKNPILVIHKVTNNNDLPSIIKQWSPNVALIVCKYSDGSGGFGSGFLYQVNDVIKVITNRHVISEATACAIVIPGDDDNHYKIANTPSASNNLFHFGDVGDWGYLEVKDGDPYFNNIAGAANKNLTICQQQEQTGDNIIVLGYPDYAGQFTDPTATQGIISGYAAPYYTTSAQIESGNSGGVAVDTNKDCYVGIPSAVQTGNYANLGRILNASVIFNLPY